MSTGWDVIDTAKLPTLSESTALSVYRNEEHRKAMLNFENTEIVERPYTKDDEHSANELEFTVKEVLPDDTETFQVEDGTIFYVESTRIYVKSTRSEKEIKISKGSFDHVGAHGNALYYSRKNESNGHSSKRPMKYQVKFYRAVYSSHNIIEEALIGKQLKDEELLPLAFCSRIRGMSKYVYRMGDDPEKDGVPIDIDLGKLELIDIELLGIHRGKLLYTGQCSNHNPLVRMWSSNIMELNIHWFAKVSFLSRLR
ncbi:hypothetical protein PENTCL1PPCAC_401 [Pristionchus entomophagus]|uniref:Uncharacterized protein n=1 Tax=Pristionchus entomophagus TaxID=358040 RepID=A0AAV5S686_9BILA|nr:hypothetical protein PENTCL1PPCAC_401 [Pristionchus entomophagus]